METIPLEMDDIFDADDDDNIPTRLPDLDDLDFEGNLEPMRDSRHDDSNEQVEDGDEPLTDNPELLAKLKSLKGASKNVQRRTFIKLDATRLTGERGLPVLPKIFKNVKLKGKHHEAEDLKTIMHHLEHWGHRLFPKMPFAEVLERAERLGVKKPVQTCVKRIRLGLPILATDFAEDEQDVRRGGDDESDERNDESTTVADSSVSNQIPNDDEIDEFLSTAAELEREQISQPAGPESPSHVHSIFSQSQSSNVAKPVLSEEAKARIERNKKLAMEKRAAKLANATNEQTNNPVPSVLSLPTLAVSDESSTKEKKTTEDDEGHRESAVGMPSDRNDEPQDDSNLIEKDNDMSVAHGASDVFEAMDTVPANELIEKE